MIVYLVLHFVICICAGWDVEQNFKFDIYITDDGLDVESERLVF